MTTIASKSQHEQLEGFLSSKNSMCSQFSLFPPLCKLKWVRSRQKLFMCETCVGKCWPQYMFMYWTVSSAGFPATFFTMQDGLPLIASLLPSALPLGFSLCISGRCFPKPQHHCNSARGQKDSAYLDQCPVHTPSVRNSTLLGSVSGSHALWKWLYLAWISIWFTPIL